MFISQFWVLGFNVLSYSTIWPSSSNLFYIFIYNIKWVTSLGYTVWSQMSGSQTSWSPKDDQKRKGHKRPLTLKNISSHYFFFFDPSTRGERRFTHPQNWKFLQKKSRVGSPWVMGRENRSWARGLNLNTIYICLIFKTSISGSIQVHFFRIISERRDTFLNLNNQ